MSEGFVTSLRKYTTKEKFDKETILEDLDLDVINYDEFYDVVFENDDYKICHPTAAEGMIPLAAGTRWLAGSSAWNTDRKAGYDEIDTESPYGPYAQYKDYYVILDKHNPKKKWMFKNGYGDIYVPSYARYPCATWVAENGDEKMWRWFLDQKFPYISTNLDKKVGSKLISDKTTFLYPDDVKNLTWYNKNGSNITKIEFAKGVTKINAGAFSGLQKVKEVVIPEGVKTIGNRAFYNTLIEKVTLPSTVTTIGDKAFGYCRALKEVNLPEGLVKLGQEAFESDTALEHMPSWPKSLNYIPNYCFSGCHSLESIDIADHVVNIGDSAFSEVEVENVIIPSSVVSIGRDSFEGKYLKYAYIPASVKEMGENAFGSIYYYSWNNDQQTPPSLVIDCEAAEKPEGWNNNWDVYSRKEKPEYRNRYDDASWHDPNRWEVSKYKVNWGVSSPRVSIKEDLDIEEVQIPGVFTEEQKDKFMDLLLSLPEMAETNKEEFLRICHEWLMNIWMSDDTPSKLKIDNYVETLSDPNIYHVPVFWAKTTDNGGKNYNICRFDEEGLNTLLSNPNEYQNTHGNVSPYNTICVSKKFLEEFLGINTDSLLECLDEDLELDVADGFPTDYNDAHWSVYHPRNTAEYQIMADGTNWFDEERYGNGDEDWHFTNYATPPLYIFENKDTGEKFLYNTRENWNNLEDAHGNDWRSESGRRNLGYNRTAGNMLGLFLSEMPNTAGLAKWAIRKWPQGLAILKTMVKADEILANEGNTITYKSDLYNKIKGASWWSRNKEDEIYKEVSKKAKQIKFPRNTHAIEENAFRDWESLESVVIPNTVTELGACAFSGCSKLTTVKLSNRIVSIGRYCFSGAKLSGDLFIPATCTYVGEDAFRNCNIDTIYCEAPSKPEGWEVNWNHRDDHYVYNDTGEEAVGYTHGRNTHREHRVFNVVWGSKGPVQEDLDLETAESEIDIPENKKGEVAFLLGVSPAEKRWKMRWWMDLEPYEETSRIVITPYKVHMGDRVYFITANLANRLLKQLNIDYKVAEPEFN